MATTSSPGDSHRAIEVIAPFEDPEARKKPVSVFLAGSIEMGKAPNWQRDISNTLAPLPVAIYNPRRPPSFVWEAKDDALFKEQVDWEHKHLVESDIIAMFLSGETKAPISLLEMGLFATSGKLIVCCEENFYRLGNVNWVCDHYGITLVHTLDQLVAEVEKRVCELEVKAGQKV